MGQGLQDDPEGRIRSINRALELRPDWLVALRLRANIENIPGHVEQAIADFQRLLAIDGDRADDYRGLGIAEQRAGRSADAIAHYTRAIELHPCDDVPYYLRARLYWQTGETQMAIEGLEKSIDLRPESKPYRLFRIYVSENRGDYVKAMADYAAILRAYPDDPDASKGKAALVRLLGTAASAVASSPD
jgi:tetratricopeptide (TPR) repeat protein